MRKWFISILVLLVAVSGIFWTRADKDMRRLILNLPTARDVLFWSVPQRDAAFRAMDRLTFLIKPRIIPSGNKAHPQSKMAILKISMTRCQAIFLI